MRVIHVHPETTCITYYSVQTAICTSTSSRIMTNTMQATEYVCTCTCVCVCVYMFVSVCFCVHTCVFIVSEIRRCSETVILSYVTVRAH